MTSGLRFRRMRVGFTSSAIALCLACTWNTAESDTLISPKLASKADLACASITGYALTQSEDKILPLLKLCGENPDKKVCEITVSLMKDFRGGRGSSYGLTCVGTD